MFYPVHQVAAPVVKSAISNCILYLVMNEVWRLSNSVLEWSMIVA